MPPPKNQDKNPVHHHDGRNNAPGELQDGDLVSLAGRARQPAGAAAQAGREVREDLGRALDDLLVAGVVVDVDGDGAEGGDLGGEVGELGVVLAFAFVGGGHGCVAVVVVWRDEG